MKGLIFTEFLAMVESAYGDDMVDTLIDITKPASGGAYTSVGSYKYNELENMLQALSKQTSQKVDILLQRFGHYLGKVLVEKYIHLFVEASSSKRLLLQFDRHLHTEVKKLYPDEALPEFKVEKSGDCEGLKLHYRSERNLHMMVYGLLEACFEYYGEPHKILKQAYKDKSQYCCIFDLVPCEEVNGGQVANELRPHLSERLLAVAPSLRKSIKESI